MFVSERIQALIHKLEVDGARWLNYLSLTMVVMALAFWYDARCYRNFNSPEAMDAAQLARNLATGKGYTTDLIRPFSVYLLQAHNHALAGGQSAGTNIVDPGLVYGRHPDLANAPLYPLVLAGLLKATRPDWQLEHGPFWTNGGLFARYRPEFYIAIFNQILLLVVVLLTFLLTKRIFDVPAAWLTSVLVLGSDALWKYSVSGLPMLLLLVIFLGLIWCLAEFEALSSSENTSPNRRMVLAVCAGLLVGLGMLTRYSFGWVIVPVVIFLIQHGGLRRMVLAAAAFLVFACVMAPWIGRNLAISGTPLGTAGYAFAETTVFFPAGRLMQSLVPNMTVVHLLPPVGSKFQTNLRYLLQDDLLRLGGGWLCILFLAGLLLGLRNVTARRIRYFTMMCLGVFLVVTALGRTEFSNLAPDVNAENLLALLTPLVVIFGVAFFLTLLNQMNVPTVQARYAVIGLVVVLACQSFIMTLLPPRVLPTAYPPYYPPDIQQFSAGTPPDELLMSDIPWAVAWYGDHQCVWNTLNSQYEFFQFNDNVKHVDGLYLSLLTLNSKLVSDCVQGGVDSWGNFALKTLVRNEIPRSFPLKLAPYPISSGLFLTDHPVGGAQ